MFACTGVSESSPVVVIYRIKFSLSNKSGIETKWTYNVRVVWLPGVKRTAFVGALETCWRERTYCSHRGINGKIRSLQKHSAWFRFECEEESRVLYSVIGLPFNQSDAANPVSRFPTPEPLTYIFFNFHWHFSFFFLLAVVKTSVLISLFFFLTLKRKALQRQISYSSIWALLDFVS